MKQARLVLVRHGQSVFNKKDLFTGWTDVELSEQGRQEAKAVGQMLKKAGVYPDICFTSWLKRAIHTAQIALHELEWEHINVIRSYKLNERHYGAWQGQKKEKIKQEVGEKAFLSVRRGYDVAPPPLPQNDLRLVWRDKKYATLKHTLLPLSESLKDTKQRVVEYYETELLQELQQNKTVLISAHGNSLRALVMHLENLTPKEVVELEIPTGEIVIFTFDGKNQIVNKEIL
ncbi:2,3-bisphosphoglycerate-dependent phosphoglycerate mutase [Sulfurimonas sp.]